MCRYPYNGEHLIARGEVCGLAYILLSAIIMASTTHKVILPRIFVMCTHYEQDSNC